jgi:hypoxanthine phosphoribosyltransferase
VTTYNLKEKVLGRKQISELVEKLGEQIRDHYSDKVNGNSLCVIGVPEACVFFAADLIREITPKGTEFPIQYATIQASSYAAGTDAQEVKIGELKMNIIGKHVLVVDTVVDTGKTFNKILNEIKKQDPKSLKTVCLIDKPARRETQVNLDWKGLTIKEDKFIVGYGLDVAHQFRNLPDVWEVEPIQN